VLEECGCTTATAAVLEECGCTAAVAVGDCPRITMEGGAAVPRVGCRSCGTLGEHR
jgi:hypothetical protein